MVANKKKKISELFNFLPKSKIKAGEGMENGKYPFYTCSNELTKYYDEYTFEPNKLIFGTGGSASLHYASEPFATSTDCYVIEAKELNVDVKYVYYYLKNNFQILEDGFKGAGLKHISKDYLSNIMIEYPNIEEQQRIVNILDKAEEIRTKKKLANEKLDEFLKSTFIDMFGDPMSNNINIKKEKLGKYLVYVQNGISRRRKIPQNIGNLVFRIKEIRENYIDYSDINRIPLNEKEKDKYKINNNELLFIRVNGNKDYVGRNAVFRGYIEDAYFNDHVMRVKIEERYMNPIYLSRFLNMSFGKEEIRKYIKTSAGQYTINQQGLSSVELTIPPIEQQNQFAQIVQKVEAQKEKNQKVIEQMDNLFNSLMQQAFNSK